MFQIYAAVNGCRTQCFWLSSSLQLCWAHRIWRISPTTMIFACASFKNHGSAKSGSLQDDDPFQNPIGPLYRWAMSIGIRTRADINSSINLNCLLNTLKAPNLRSIREYPSLSWCHFEYFVSRHWFLYRLLQPSNNSENQLWTLHKNDYPFSPTIMVQWKVGISPIGSLPFKYRDPFFAGDGRVEPRVPPPNTPHTATPDTLK